MRYSDLLRFGLESLWQQKLRTLLSLAGVLIGAFLLAFGFTAGAGIQHTVLDAIRSNETLRQISIFPSYANEQNKIPALAIDVADVENEERQRRIQQRLEAEWWSQNGVYQQVRLSPERVHQLEQLPHVVEVVPRIIERCNVRFEDYEGEHSIKGVSRENEHYQNRVIQGSYFAPGIDRVNDTSKRTKQPIPVLVNEFLAYKWGFRNQSELRSLIGKTTTIQFPQTLNAPSPALPFGHLLSGRASQQEKGNLLALVDDPERLKSLGLSKEQTELIRRFLEKQADAIVVDEFPKSLSVELVIAGVFRDPEIEEIKAPRRFGFDGDQADLILPIGFSVDIALQLPQYQENGFGRATLLVDSDTHLKEVAEQVESMSLQQYSMLQFVEQLIGKLSIGQYVMMAVAGAILFVASLGITNTMIMTVMERTFEIGIMKSVGAKDSQILAIFLFEGALVGFLGGAISLLSLVAIAPLLDAWLLSSLQQRWNIEITENIFAIPWWVTGLVLSFSTLVTTLATLIPARRAARISPITALRLR